MLNIPTATTKGPRAGTRTPEQREKFLANKAAKEASGGLVAHPTSADPLGAGPGMTSLDAAPPTAYSKTTPYQYSSTPWEDPVAQSVMKSWYEDPAQGLGTGFYDRELATARTYNDQPGVYNSQLSPARFSPEQKEAYINQGGTYYNQFTPAQNAGVPYVTATGEPAPVMNLQTGVAETPIFDASGKITGQLPTSTVGSGSFHTLQPEVMNKMWR